MGGDARQARRRALMRVHMDRLSSNGEQEQQDAGSQSPPVPTTFGFGQNTHLERRELFVARLYNEMPKTSGR
jgi:hypothetical protein